MRKMPFDIKVWLKNPGKKVFDEDDNEVTLYQFDDTALMQSCGKMIDVVKEGVRLYFEFDPNDISIRAYSVSDFARYFQKSAKPNEKAAVLSAINWFIDLAGIFGHHAFFTKELWRKVEGFEDEDPAQIIAAFLHWWVRDEFGFQNHPCGATWTTCSPTKYYEDDECFDDYIKHYMPVFRAYSDWMIRQR